MINEIGNHYDMFVADGGGNGELTIRRSIDKTEARFSLANGTTVTSIDMDKAEVRKLGEALVRLSERMDSERPFQPGDE